MVRLSPFCGGKLCVEVQYSSLSLAGAGLTLGCDSASSFKQAISNLIFEVIVCVIPEVTGRWMHHVSDPPSSNDNNMRTFLLRVGRPSVLRDLFFVSANAHGILWSIYFKSGEIKDSKEEQEANLSELVIPWFPACSSISYINTRFRKIRFVKEHFLPSDSRKFRLTLRGLPKESFTNPELGEDTPAELYLKAQVVASTVMQPTETRKEIEFCRPHTDFVRCDGQIIFFVTLTLMDGGGEHVAVGQPAPSVPAGGALARMMAIFQRCRSRVKQPREYVRVSAN